MTKEDLFYKYKSTFNGIGTLGEEYDLTLIEDATPVIHAPRRVPLAIKDKLK